MPAGCELSGSGARWSLVVHGGFMSPRRWCEPDAVAESRAAALEAVRAAAGLLERGAPGVEAVEAALVIMEDCPQFDAGRGSALTADGRVELDASLMRGEDLAAGAVAGVTRARNPIRAARAVLEQSPHVLLQGAGADAFVAARGLELADPEWFITERMREELRAVQARAQADSPGRDLGTVGCVVRDTRGHITAGTSTGGITNKLPGRVGDSPIIGAGTYADSRWCGVSCTGQGEYFVRVAAARTVAALMELTGVELAAALADVVQGRIAALGGKGGAIAVDRLGNVAAVANMPGLVFAALTSGGTQASAFDGQVGSAHDAPSTP